MPLHSLGDRGSVKRKPGQNRPRTRTAREDHHLSIIPRRDRDATAALLSRELNLATRIQISRVTISGSVHEKEVFFRGAIGLDFAVMDHTALRMFSSYCKVKISLEWIDPDLNPIEHVLEDMRGHLVAQVLPPGNTQQLRQMPNEEWTHLSQ
ncbi:hypothetical protein TNCV_1526851 [Trichonephila clavipes]|nr:hypothetical protein TNCV_1526851 [Trichonephila clavipes]